MLIDFSYRNLVRLLYFVKENFNCVKRFDSIGENNYNNKLIIIRHDIDKNPRNALKIAKIESKMGIKGIYYFRVRPSVFKINIIREIALLGHEIGYHYEDLTYSHGNFEKAIISFEQNLQRFREIVPVKSICMDGRPLSKYNNLDLWKHYNYRDYGLEFEPYLDVDFNKVLYLTDTGRGWNLLKYIVRDKVGNPFNYHNKTTYELIEDLEKGLLPDKIMITIHPQRWHDNWFMWLKELLIQRIKNVIKYILIKTRKYN